MQHSFLFQASMPSLAVTSITGHSWCWVIRYQISQWSAPLYLWFCYFFIICWRRMCLGFDPLKWGKKCTLHSTVILGQPYFSKGKPEKEGIALACSQVGKDMGSMSISLASHGIWVPKVMKNHHKGNFEIFHIFNCQNNGPYEYGKPLRPYFFQI